MKPPKIEGAKVHRPHAVVDFFKADVLIGEDVTDVDPVGLPANAAVAADAAHFEMGGIVDRCDVVRIRPR